MANMLTVSAAEFQWHFGRYQDEALKQPVSITRNGRDRLVVLAVEEYQRLKRRDRRVFRTDELSAADVQELAQTEMDPRYNYLDDELT